MSEVKQMKNRVKALLLASGLTLSMFGTAVYAAESATEAVEESVVSETETASGAVSADSGTTAAATENVDTAEYMRAYLVSYTGALLEALPAMTEEELTSMRESEQWESAAANWDSVKEELGAFVTVNSADGQLSEDGKSIVVTSDVSYAGVSEKTKVTVTTTWTFTDKQYSSMDSVSMKWNIDYPKSKLFAEAGLNTLLGMGIVFVVLLFLSFLIGRIKVVNAFGKKEEAPKAAPAPAAPAPAPVVEEEVTDDEELIAVIAAAIAAAEQTSTDGFVVRSIRKVNRR